MYIFTVLISGLHRKGKGWFTSPVLLLGPKATYQRLRKPPPWSIHLKAMTLTELLVVLAILGILLLMAFPALKPLFSKTYALEAKTNLRHLAQLQHIYHLEHSRFSSELIGLGFEPGVLITEENGTAHFQIEILEASQEDFIARATAVTDFDGDGTFNVWEIDRYSIPKEVVID